MNKRSKRDHIQEHLRDRIIGLGERSIRKSYYPMLQKRVAELERFRALLDQTNDAIFLVQGSTGTFVDVNQTACDFFGFTPEQFLNMSISELWPSQVTAVIAELLQENDCDQRMVEARMSGSGNEFPSEINFKKVHFQDQDYVVAVVRDITERKKSEENLRRAEHKYRSIVENAVEGIFQASVDGPLIDANPALARMFGYESPEEMINDVRDLADQLYVNPQERNDLLEKVLDQGAVSGFEAQFRRRDGSIIWGAVHVRPVYDGKGNLLYTEGIFQNITGRKQAEAENQRLEEQLRQSQKMEAVGTLAGGIAHDFNNLLQAISGYVQLLLFTKDEQDGDTKYLKEIEKAMERATDLVKRLLTFSRKMELKLSCLNINEIVSSTVSLLERTIPKMISIQTRLAPDLKEVSGDPTQMEQILMNLANNAVDAMPHGGTLTIETSNYDLLSDYRAELLSLDPGSFILIQISDSGHGMDSKTMSHIFEPFFTTKEPGRGTGLGLSTVYGIVKGHRGHISCSSRPGEGTSFSILLPADEAGCETDQETNTAEDGTLSGTETVLLADDEEIILDIAQDMLAHYGYETMRATSGEDVLEIYSKDRDEIDLILLDLGMPGMGGEKCLAELRKMNPDVKVIVASGYTMHKLARDPEKYGAKDFMAKPYRLEKLLETIRSVLG